MGIVFALYFVAIKCRSPSIRRRAVDFLSKVQPQREGIWDARVLRAVSQYAADFEESGCLGPLTEGSETWPLKEQRIHGIYIFPHCDLEMRIQRVKFVWQPLGPEEGWKDWDKDIVF
jgi:hypothetical protein